MKEEDSGDGKGPDPVKRGEAPMTIGRACPPLNVSRWVGHFAAHDEPPGTKPPTLPVPLPDQRATSGPADQICGIGRGSVVGSRGRWITSISGGSPVIDTPPETSSPTSMVTRAPAKGIPSTFRWPTPSGSFGHNQIFPCGIHGSKRRSVRKHRSGDAADQAWGEHDVG